MSERVALQLAGLQTQVLWGEFDPKSISRYADVDSYLPKRILTENKRMSDEDWKGAIAGAHKVCCCLFVYVLVYLFTRAAIREW